MTPLGSPKAMCRSKSHWTRSSSVMRCSFSIKVSTTSALSPGSSTQRSINQTSSPNFKATLGPICKAGDHRGSTYPRKEQLHLRSGDAHLPSLNSGHRGREFLSSSPAWSKMARAIQRNTVSKKTHNNDDNNNRTDSGQVSS